MKLFFGILIYSFYLLQIYCQATTYFVREGGDDNASGTTQSTAWESISKVNSQTFLPGDSILFRSGDKWRGTLEISNSGSKGNNIYFGRYGEGENPKLLGSEQATDWTLIGIANVWQTATSLDNYSDEYYGGRLFFILPDSIIYGNYKEYDAAFSSLVENNDYTVNGTTHYVYSTTDPNTTYESIEVNQHERVVSIDYFQSYLEFNGIDILFGRRAGFFSGYPAPPGRGATDLIFRNCYIGYTGAKGSGSAYGIACYHSNLLIENCIFSDNGRRSISFNAYASGGNPGRRVENIIIRNNVFKRGYHTTSLDLSTQDVDGDTVDGVYFYNNYIDDSQITEIGDWGGSNQIFIQSGIGESYMTNIYIVNNVFVQATWRNILLEGNRAYYIWNNTIVGHNPVITSSPWGNVGYGDADSLDYRNNIIYDNLPDNNLENYGLHGYNSDTYFINRDYNLYWQLYPSNDRCFTSIYENGNNDYYDITEWEDFLADFPRYEQNSPQPSEPEFVDYDGFNFSLTSLSPAKNEGIVLPDVYVTDSFGNTENITKNDFIGNPRSVSNPSIGAYEFTNITSAGQQNINTDNFYLGQNYPNPFNPSTTIEYSISANVFSGGVSAGRDLFTTLKIYNLLGQEVAILVNENQKPGIYKVKFDGTGLPSGLYFISLKAGDFSASKKTILLK